MAQAEDDDELPVDPEADKAEEEEEEEEDDDGKVDGEPEDKEAKKALSQGDDKPLVPGSKEEEEI